MKSTNYREQKKKIGKHLEVVSKMDVKTGLPVCLNCNEIISEEEALENDEICDTCYKEKNNG